MKFFKKIILVFIIIIFTSLIYSILKNFTHNNIKVIINSNTKSELQFFYKTDSLMPYSEKYVVNKNISIGNNELVFPLKTDISEARIDVANSSYKIKIKDISLNYLFYSLPFELDESKSYQINNITKNQDKSIDIMTIENATDPQIFFKIDIPKFQNYFKIIYLAISILLSLLIIIILYLIFLIYKRFIFNSTLFYLSIIFVTYTLVSFLLIPNIKVIINSNTKSELQFFYKTDSLMPYSEKYVVNKNISIGNNELVFPLKTDISEARIDVANSSYKIKIKDISLNYLFYSLPFELDESKSYQINNITKNQDKSIDIMTIENATDPQIFLVFNQHYFEKIYLAIKLILTILISFMIVLCIKKISEIKKIIVNTEKLISDFYVYLKNLNIDFSKFYIYFLIGFVFHIFEISNFLLSPDDEYSAFRITPEAWVYDGRWVGFLIERFIFDQPTMPFIPNIASCILMALAYIILLRAHNIQSSLRTYFIFPIFSAFPTLWTINEFYGNMVMVAFGFFILSVSVLVFVELNKLIFQNKFSIVKAIKILFFPSLFLAIAIGTYQSFAMLGIAMLSGILFLELYKNDIIIIKRYLINSFLFIIYGIILYGIINKIFRIFFPSERNYIDGFIKITDVDFIFIISSVYQEIVKVYTGSNEFFGISMGSLLILIFVGFLSVIFSNKNRLWLIFLLVVVLISPFLLHFLSGGNPLPTRSMVALPYVIWLLTFLAIDNKSYIRNILGIIIVGFLLIQQSSALGQYAAATQIGQLHDRTLAADLYKRISESNPNFNPKEVHILDIYGYKEIETIYPKVSTSTINASFFDWDAGNMSRMISYMRLLGYSNLTMVDKASIEKNILYFNKMPSYPNKESVQYINGIYLIKLGDKPDVYRRK